LQESKMEERLKAEAEEDELDKLAAQLIMQETREAHKRAEKEGVLAYLGMASTSTSLLDQWQALHPGQRLAATSSASARAKKKVPDKVFLQNLLSHTVGSNELQRRQEDWYERESMERRRKQRARKDKEARNPRKRRRKEEEEEEEESERQREEKEEGENKHDESAAVPMIGPKFKRVKGRGSFAYMRGGSERMKSIFAASNKEEEEEAENEATQASPFVIRDEKLERWKEEERQRRRTEERARSTEEQKKENKKKEIKGKKEKKKRRKDRKEKRKKRKKEKKKEKRRDYSDSS
ncbi:TFIIS central domain-containing protein, partial [Balamuthia mandrillaris]